MWFSAKKQAEMLGLATKIYTKKAFLFIFGIDKHFAHLNLFIFSELNKNPVEGFSAGLVDESDIHKWEVLIIGPPDTL